VLAPTRPRPAGAGPFGGGSVRASANVGRRCQTPVHELLATEIALAKLGARGISAEEVAQLPRNRYVTLRNPHGGGEPGTRRFLIGRTRGGRVLALVLEQTLDPTTWLIITGWSATDRERILLERMR
jgi:hypothetical protein